MNTATKPLLTLVPPVDKDKSKLRIPRRTKITDAPPPAESKTDRFDLINQFDEACFELESYLDAIYRIGFSGHYIEMNSETILVIAQKAEDALKEMEKAFEKLTERTDKGGK